MISRLCHCLLSQPLARYLQKYLTSHTHEHTFTRNTLGSANTQTHLIRVPARCPPGPLLLLFVVDHLGEGPQGVQQLRRRAAPPISHLSRRHAVQAANSVGARSQHRQARLEAPPVVRGSAAVLLWRWVDERGEACLVRKGGHTLFAA